MTAAEFRCIVSGCLRRCSCRSCVRTTCRCVPVGPLQSLSSPLNICTDSTLISLPYTLACTAVAPQLSSELHAGNKDVCSGHNLAETAAGARTPLRSAPFLRASRPAGRERSPPAAAGCTQRRRAVAAPRRTEQADLLLPVPPPCRRADPGYVDPAGQEEVEEGRGEQLWRKTNKQTHRLTRDD